MLIQRRDIHLDSLAERLREPRVRGIIEPVLSGELPADIPDDDWQYVTDLGLIPATEGPPEIANPIYREIILRVLSDSLQRAVILESPTWLTPGGRMDPDRLLDTFLEFWRENAEILLRAAPYPEAAPHLVMMAFLHRVVNGDGTSAREYGAGRGRLDLLIDYRGDRIALELKVWRAGRPDPPSSGRKQLDAYLARLGLTRGRLVIFDRRRGLPPLHERVNVEDMPLPSGRMARVIRA